MQDCASRPGNVVLLSPAASVGHVQCDSTFIVDKQVNNTPIPKEVDQYSIGPITNEDVPSL